MATITDIGLCDTIYAPFEGNKLFFGETKIAIKSLLLRNISWNTDDIVSHTGECKESVFVDVLTLNRSGLD